MAYIKTNWEDFPNTSAPITAEALQNIEDGIEALDTDKADKEVVLYNDATGTNGTVTLSETSANFSYLEVFYGNSPKSGCGSVKVYSPNGKGVDMAVHNFSDDEYPSGALYISQTRATIAGTTITPMGASYCVFRTANVFSVQALNTILIYRVVGYR
jgi:hypothetical protein